MEPETIIQQKQQQQQQQQQQQERRPESVLASEAEKRASTSHGRPETRESVKNQTQNDQRPPSERTNDILLQNQPKSKDFFNQNETKTPHTTPRDSGGIGGIDYGEDILKSVVTGEDAVPGEKGVFDSVLEEDELFMALSPEEREEWEKMMIDRERLLEDSKEKHQNWSDSFTRRRMFAYTRMRKLNLSYQERIKLFSNISSTISNLAQKSIDHTPKKKSIAKRMSEPLLGTINEPIETKSTDSVLKRSRSSGSIETDNISSQAARGDDRKGETCATSSGMNDNGKMSSNSKDVCTVRQVT